jgi:hypothetical protein
MDCKAISADLSRIHENIAGTLYYAVDEPCCEALAIFPCDYPSERAKEKMEGVADKFGTEFTALGGNCFRLYWR